tara:strand:+ start:96 stop:494 length:399 start_codon:yes stop_codon:yes gene_type:complete
MQPQNPFDIQEDSEEDLNLKNQIDDMKMQFENLMLTDHRGMSMESKSQLAEKLASFDFKINELQGKLGKGKITSFPTKKNSQMFNQPKTMKSFSTNGVSFPNGGQIPKTMNASERKWLDNGKIIPSTPQFNF